MGVTKNAVLVAIFILLVIVGFVLFKLPKEEEVTAPKPVVFKKVIKLSGLQIAEESIKFLDESSKPDYRIYKNIYNCYLNESGKGCYWTGSEHHHSGWYGAARLGVYLHNGKEEYLKGARHVFEGYILANVSGNYQECTEEKNREEWCTHSCLPAGAECVGSFMGMHDWYIYSNDSKYLTAFKKAGDFLVNQFKPPQKPLRWTYLDIGKLAHAYEHTGNVTYLDTAITKLSEYEELSKKEGTIYSLEETFYLYSCWIKWSEIQIFKMNKDPKYLNSVKAFFDKMSVGSNVELINQLPAIQFCITTLMDLYHETNDSKYKKEALNITQFVVKNYWDSSLDPKYNGDNGFLFTKYDAGENSKVSLETAYMAITLTSDFPNDIFEVN